MLNELKYDPARGAAPNPSDLIRRAADEQSDLATVLVIGARCSGKTYSLFEYGISCAEEGRRVTFIARDEAHLVASIRKIALSQETLSDALRRVTVRYIPNEDVLCSFFATIHTLSSPPEVMIVDDLGSYCSFVKNDAARSAAKICAYMTDALLYLGQNSDRLQLIASDSVSSALALPAGNESKLTRHQVYERFFSSTVRLHNNYAEANPAANPSHANHITK